MKAVEAFIASFYAMEPDERTSAMKDVRDFFDGYEEGRDEAIRLDTTAPEGRYS